MKCSAKPLSQRGFIRAFNDLKILTVEDELNRADKDKALATLEEARRLDPSYFDIYRTLTYIYTSSCQGKNGNYSPLLT